MLAKATGNDLFLMMLHPVMDILRDSRRLTQQTPGATKRAHILHRAFFDEICQGAAEQARLMMQAHMDQVWQDIQEHLSDEE